MKTYYSKIIGTGSYLPEKVLTNDDLSKMVDTSDEWIFTRSGIRERHIVADNETSATMAEIAAKKALYVAKLSPKDLDLIIVATCTPEYFVPSTACLIQARLEANHCMSFDMNAACSGFVYALSVADQYIRQGVARHALVVGSEGLSRILDWKDRNTCVLLGDGAGAVVLKQSDQPGILHSQLYADGHYKESLMMASGLYHKNPERVFMKGREIFKLAVEGMTNSVKILLNAQNMTIDELNWIIPHQANIRIIDSILQKLNFPKEKVIITLDKHANTSAASIPLALDQGVRDGRVKPGQTVLMAAFGGGLTWGGVLLRY